MVVWLVSYVSVHVRTHMLDALQTDIDMQDSGVKTMKLVYSSSKDKWFQVFE